MTGGRVSRSPERSTLVAATSAMVLLVLDSTIVGVLLPDMRTELALSAAAQAWLVGIYLLTLAVLMPLGGRLCDAWGAARTFAVGMAGFTVASAGVGLSTAGPEVIAWRGVAGCAAALLVPAGLAVLTEVYPDDRRAAALAVYTGVGQGFATVGPLAGGLCAQFLGWRWGFLLNVPVGLVGLVLMARARPHTPRRPSRSLLDLGLLRIRPFAAASVILFALGFGMTTATVYGAAALQETLHLAPAVAGVALLPLVVPLLVTTRWAGRNAVRVGARAVGVAGTLALAAGLTTSALGLLTDGIVVVCVGMVPAGVGIGLLLGPMTNVAMTAAPAERRGQASGLVSTVRQVGAVVGVVGAGALGTLLPHPAAGAPDPLPVTLALGLSALLAVAGTVVAALGFPRAATDGAAGSPQASVG
jgi:MFS transporter, DHA2 family, methylenomycin A resistance protein